MIRPGHHRPLGTTTTMRFPDWPAETRPPELGDVAMYAGRGPGGDPDAYRRAYVVVGVAETATGYRLHLERVAYGTLPASLDPDAIWPFHDLPRPHAPARLTGATAILPW